MPFKHGKATGVYLDGFDMSPMLTSADTSVDADPSDTTAFQAPWKTAITGPIGAKVDFNGFYDPTSTILPSLNGVDYSLTGGVLTVAPGGASAIGDMARLLSIANTNYVESSPVGGVVAIKWSALGSTALGMGWMLHPLAEDTNTTTGAERDDGVATTTGWQAHLHVTAVDAGGGSWVIKLQDAAVSNTYSDVAGGAFTAKTAAGGQRLLSASGATLRRYVRYVATRTGGSAGDGITFVLAYARNV